MKKGSECAAELARQMYLYFSEYSDVGAPSYTKFARRARVTLEELKKYRKYKKFDAAWRECSEIRRDYLTDMALSKRIDASFAKFIYSLEYPEGDNDGSKEMKITLDVLGDGI